jgi:hypothetical protein
MVRKIWNDPVWSKVIAVALAAGGVWMFQHLAVTWAVPGWLFGLLVVTAVGSPLVAMMYLKRRASPSANALSPKTSPTLLVKCSKSRQLFITNDGPDAAVNVEIGPLVHEEEHEITVLMSPFGSIPAKATEQRAITVAQRQPNSGGPLWDAMRFGSMLPQPSDSVTVKFADTKGNRFSQKFELTSEVDGSVTWKPGPVLTV